MRNLGLVERERKRDSLCGSNVAQLSCCTGERKRRLCKSSTFDTCRYWKRDPVPIYFSKGSDVRAVVGIRRNLTQLARSKVVQSIPRHFWWSRFSTYRQQKIDVKCGDKRHKSHISSLLTLILESWKKWFFIFWKNFSFQKSFKRAVTSGEIWSIMTITIKISRCFTGTCDTIMSRQPIYINWISFGLFLW